MSGDIGDWKHTVSEVYYRIEGREGPSSVQYALLLESPK